ncbi:MAG: hypothetical protein OSA37_01855 [Flavobacteriales bacterium]|nr:hypothetical protein [Flavobacteriales bacterium]
MVQDTKATGMESPSEVRTLYSKEFIQPAYLIGCSQDKQLDRFIQHGNR